MKNKTAKLISYLLVGSIFLSGCKMNLQSIINDNKKNASNEDKTKSTTSYIEENTETQLIETIENETISQETIEIKKPETNIVKEKTIASVTTDTNLYSSNTTESLIISELKINDITHKILFCDNNWTIVRYNNHIGYVYNDYLEYSEELTEIEYNHQEKNDIVLTTTDLNFRISPTTESEIILTFQKNTELQVIAETDNEWLLVKNNGILGYVSKKYTISLLDKAKEQYQELNLQKINVQKIVYSITELNIRTGPSTENEIIGMLSQYESVRVLFEYNSWYFIMTNDYNFGFISKKYTKKLDNIFVIVDINVQRLYLYNNNELYYTTPITTGKDSTPSDIGLFKIWYKGTNEEIVPGHPEYTVNYWMPYNYNMEGLHDAPWRDAFGTQDYKVSGSNGCINIPPEITDEIYEIVEIGTKVLVHKR